MSDWEKIKYKSNVGLEVKEPNKVHVIDENSPLYDIISKMSYEEIEEFFKSIKEEL